MHAKTVPTQLVTTLTMVEQSLMLLDVMQVLEGASDDARETVASREAEVTFETGGAMQFWTSARMRKRA